MNNLRYSDFRIIAIDDDEFALYSLSKQFEILGVKSVTCIDDVEKGLELLSEEEFDILFLDLNMPKMTGIEVLNVLARIDYIGCIVLLSGVDQSLINTSKDIAEGQGLNIIGSFHKPISLENLRNTLDTLLD